MRVSWVWAGVVVVACSSSTTNKVEPCGEGEIQACTLADGCVGTKVCGADGTFGPCACGAGAAGGNAGAAGADASAGSGGSGASAGSGGSGASSGSGGADASAGSGGADASAGAGGTAGTSGAGGSAGSSGASGNGGAAGTSGAGGSAGTSGAGGTAGTAGTSGAGGTGGSAGASGAGGSAGTAGAGGTGGSAGAGGVSATLVAYWKFDDSGTVATDSSGNGNDGALHGGSWISGQKGGALSLSAGDYVDVGDKLNGLGIPFSVTVWLKRTSGAAVVVRSDANPGALQAGWEIVTPGANGKFQLLYFDGTGSSSRGGAASFGLVAGSWHHYAIVVEGPTTMTFYRDGTDYGSGGYFGTGGAMVTDSNPFYIGSNGAAGSYDGAIDDLRVYQGALTAADVTTIMNQ